MIIKKKRLFSYVFKRMKDLCLLACYTYIVTFALFPGVSINQKIFEIGDYNMVTIITIYNVFDTIGRFFVGFIKPTKILNSIIVLGRSILLINVAILGITNGMGATLTFGLASNLAEDEIKKQTGGLIGFFSILGIFLGSVLAFGTKAIIKTFKKN